MRAAVYDVLVACERRCLERRLRRSGPLLCGVGIARPANVGWAGASGARDRLLT